MCASFSSSEATSSALLSEPSSSSFAAYFNLFNSFALVRPFICGSLSTLPGLSLVLYLRHLQRLLLIISYANPPLPAKFCFEQRDVAMTSLHREYI